MNANQTENQIAGSGNVLGAGENLKALLAVGELIADRDLDLATEGTNSCESPCCLLGWYNRRHNTELVWWPANTWGAKGLEARKHMAEYFGIANEDIDALFGPNYGEDSDRTELDRRLDVIRARLQSSSGDHSNG
jgi:hypothetical protein